MGLATILHNITTCFLVNTGQSKSCSSPHLLSIIPSSHNALLVCIHELALLSVVPMILFQDDRVGSLISPPPSYLKRGYKWNPQMQKPRKVFDLRECLDFCDQVSLKHDAPNLSTVANIPP